MYEVCEVMHVTSLLFVNRSCDQNNNMLLLLMANNLTKKIPDYSRLFST